MSTPNPSNTTVWERGAVAVKNTDVSNPYLETIRSSHDPAMHLKTVEDELKGTIGAALGKQGDKIRRATHQMELEWQRYQELCCAGNDTDMSASATRYKEHRKAALTARWELMVHRQAAGFVVNNHKYVTDMYPIPAALSIPIASATACEARPRREEKLTKKKFTDQLDWWQRVGRWR